MIRRLLRLIPTALLWFCVATVLAQTIGAGWILLRGGVDREKVFRVLAAAYGVDVDGGAERPPPDPFPDRELPTYEDLATARRLRSLDLDLREQAMAKGLDELRALQVQLAEERKRYNQLKQSFDDQLAELQRETAESSIIEVQRTLESIQPRQAKDQILRMLEEGAMLDVVTILKSMPLDKRRKIVGEFRSEEELEKLAEILRQIREGVPEVSLIDQTREQLRQFPTR